MIGLQVAILSAVLIATPGPIDRNGGHLDFEGNYHVHAGPSYQFRYVDGTGRIWEGQGPRPEENLRNFSDDFLWETMFIPFILITTIIAFVVYVKAENWAKRFVKSRAYAHLVMHRRRDILAHPAYAYAFAPSPSLRPAMIAGRHALSERRNRLRRAVLRKNVDRRRQESLLSAT